MPPSTSSDLAPALPSKLLLLLHVVAVAAGVLLLAPAFLPTLTLTADAAGMQPWRGYTLLEGPWTWGAGFILLGCGAIATVSLSAITRRPRYRWGTLVVGCLALLLSLVAYRGLVGFRDAAPPGDLVMYVAHPQHPSVVAPVRGSRLRLLPIGLSAGAGTFLILSGLIMAGRGRRAPRDGSHSR